MDQIILYQETDGQVILLIPTGELSIEDTAQKDVPPGCPYLIATRDDIPSDFMFYEAWEADFSNPDGYGLGHEAWVAKQEASK